MLRAVFAGLVALATTTPLLGQTPQPAPGVRPGAPAPANAAQRAGATASQQPAPPADGNAPTSAVVGFPIYPGAQFLGSFDAGKMQRYYLFGTQAAYAEVVKYYQGVLRDRGDEVFREPTPTHMFAQRFREETMAFPPGVTVKDFRSVPSGGYPNVKLGAQPATFPTVVMIVPPPPAAGSGR